MRLFAFSKDGIKKKDLRCGRGQNVDTCLHSVGVHVAARVDADGGGGGQICPLCHLHDVGCAKAAPVVRCDENSVYKSPASIYSILQLVSLTRLTSSQEFPSWMFLKANRKRQMRPTSYCPSAVGETFRPTGAEISMRWWRAAFVSLPIGLLFNLQPSPLKQRRNVLRERDAGCVLFDEAPNTEEKTTNRFQLVAFYIILFSAYPVRFRPPCPSMVYWVETARRSEFFSHG